MEQSEWRDREPPVVVGVDDSEGAIEALRWGARLAEALAKPLEVIAAWQYAPAGMGIPPVGVVPVGLNGHARHQAEGAVKKAIGSVFGMNPPDGFVTRVIEGSAREVLLGASEHAELLVVGSRGHGGFAGLLLGSVSRACAERAKCPVLVVH